MKLKIDEEKVFEFKMNTVGCSWEELKGYFRLVFEGIEYGFPVNVEEGVIKVNIPVFKDVLHENVLSSLYEEDKKNIVKARLDLIANNEIHIQPWSGDINMEIPMSVKLTEEKETLKKNETNVTIISADIKEKPEEKIEEKTKNDKKNKILDIFDSIKLKKEEKEEKKKSKFSKMLG